VFQRCDAADFNVAIDNAIGECERFPVPAVLRKLLPKKEKTVTTSSRCLFHRNNPDKKAQEYDYTCERCNELCRSTWDNVPRESKSEGGILPTGLFSNDGGKQSAGSTLSAQLRESATIAESRPTMDAGAKRAGRSTPRG
jgi:hypothetical protein